MKFIKLYLLFSLVLGISMHSCKKNGCTDRRATNFNRKVKEEDGSCLYKDHGLFAAGNYHGTEETSATLIFDTTIYHTYSNINFTVQRVGLFDTLLFDGYLLVYYPTDSEPSYFSFYAHLHPAYDLEQAYIRYFPKDDSIYYSYSRATLAGGNGRRYFGKKK